MIGDWIEKVDYPQLPDLTEDELLSFYGQAQFARLETSNDDSTIHIAPTYFKYKDGQIIMASQCPSRKVRNIKRNKNVSVLIDKTEVPFIGALIYGIAELDYEDVVQKCIEIFNKEDIHRGCRDIRFKVISQVEMCDYPCHSHPHSIL